MNINQIWSEDKITHLKNNYSDSTNVYSYFPTRSRQSIWYKAWELGLKAKGRGYIDGNFKFFDKWSAEMAYVLGFICANGNIHKNVLTLVQKDPKYLLRLIRIMGWEKVNVRAFKTGVSLVAIRNEYMTTRLHELKIPERKSLILGKIPVPKKFMVNFILGYIDGDGCICSYYDKRRKKTYLEVSVLGTYNFLNWIQSEIHNITDMPKRKVRTQFKGSKIYKIKYGTSLSLSLCEWLYTNNNFYMERKFNKYIDFVKDRKLTNPFCNTPGNHEADLSEVVVDDIVRSL